VPHRGRAGGPRGSRKEIKIGKIGKVGYAVVPRAELPKMLGAPTGIG